MFPKKLRILPERSKVRGFYGSFDLRTEQNQELQSWNKKKKKTIDRIKLINSIKIILTWNWAWTMDTKI